MSVRSHADITRPSPLRTSIRHIRRPHDPPNLLHALQVWGKASVHGKDLLIDDGGNGEAVEAVCERLPELDVESTLALVVEAVDAVDRGALVVATQDEEVFGVLDLVRQEPSQREVRMSVLLLVVATSRSSPHSQADGL